MQREVSVVIAVGVLLLVFSSLLSAQSAPSKYKIEHTFHIAGEGGWDCLAVDESTGRLFVSHGSVVQVIDETTGAVLGIIPDALGVHAIAVAPDLNKGFTSNGKDNSITVFDLTTLAVTGKIQATGKNPDLIIYDAFSGRVFCFNAKSDNATVVDAKTSDVVGTVMLDGNPEFPVVDGKGNLFINAATADNPRPRPAVKPGTFVILDVAPLD